MSPLKKRASKRSIIAAGATALVVFGATSLLGGSMASAADDDVQVKFISDPVVLCGEGWTVEQVADLTAPEGVEFDVYWLVGGSFTSQKETFTGTGEPFRYEDWQAKSQVDEGVENFKWIVDGTTYLDFDVNWNPCLEGGDPYIVGDEEPEPDPDPSVTLGTVTTTPNDEDGVRSVDVSGSVTTEHVPSGSTVAVRITTNTGLTKVVPVDSSGNFSSTLEGSFPDGTTSVTVQPLLDGEPIGTPTTKEVTFTKPDPDPDPGDMPVSVKAKFTPRIEGGKSVVDFVLDFDNGGQEGSWTVVIYPKGSDKPLVTVGFTDSEPAIGSFPYECGDATFVVVLSDDSEYYHSTGKDYEVTIPCPTDNGGGGDGDGDGNGGGTGGGDNGSGDGDHNGGDNGSGGGDTDGSGNGNGGHTSDKGGNGSKDSSGNPKYHTGNYLVSTAFNPSPLFGILAALMLAVGGSLSTVLVAQAVRRRREADIN